jgi:hypothetical protein
MFPVQLHSVENPTKYLPDGVIIIIIIIITITVGLRAHTWAHIIIVGLRAHIWAHYYYYYY